MDNYYKWEFLRRNITYQDDCKEYYAKLSRKKGESDKAYNKRRKQAAITAATNFRNKYKKIGLYFPLPSNIPASEQYPMFDVFPAVECKDPYDVKEVIEENIPPRFLFVKIDLDHTKERIMREVELYLDCKMIPYKNKKKAKEGKDQKRARNKNYDTYLTVWDLRDKKLTFPQIAVKVYRGKNIKKGTDLVYKNYARAYELIYGKKYDPEEIKAELRERGINKEVLNKTCSNCADKKCLEGFVFGKESHPCPEVIDFVEQDQGYRAEKQTSQSSPNKLYRQGKGVYGKHDENENNLIEDIEGDKAY